MRSHRSSDSLLSDDSLYCCPESFIDGNAYAIVPLQCYHYSTSYCHEDVAAPGAGLAGARPDEGAPLLLLLIITVIIMMIRMIIIVVIHFNSSSNNDKT